MRKLLCHGGAIAYNKNYIFVGRNKIDILARSAMDVCGSVTGFRNIIDMKADERYLYVKNSSGAYGMIDLNTFQIIKKGGCREKKSTSHDNCIYSLSSGILFDLIQLKDGLDYIVEYDFCSRKYRKLCVGRKGYCCIQWLMDVLKHKAYVFAVQIWGPDPSPEKCYITAVDLTNFCVEQTVELLFERNVRVKGLVGSRSVLLGNMEILDIFTKEAKALENQKWFCENNCGNSFKVRKLAGDRFALVSSEKYFVYSLSNGKIEYSCDCNFAAGIEIIDGRAFLAPWDAFLLDEETEVK